MSTVDYTKYSIDELYDVRDNINLESPNYPRLMEEIEKRKGEFQEHQQAIQENAIKFNRSYAKGLGYFQIAAGVVIAIAWIMSLAEGTETLFNSTVIISIIALNLIAGYTCIKDMFNYYWVSIVNQGLQLFSFAVGSSYINYSGLGGIYLQFVWGGDWSIKTLASFAPGFQIAQLNVQLTQQWIGIDLLAIAYISILLTVLRIERNENKSDEA